MAKFTDEEVFDRIEAFESFKKEAEPLLKLIPEIKRTQDEMITAQAVAEATEEQRYEKIATAAVSKFQKSTWYRIRQVSIAAGILILIIMTIVNSIDTSTGKIDTAELIKTINELAK